MGLSSAFMGHPLGKTLFILLTLAAFIASIVVGGMVGIYLFLALPQGILVTNWGIGAVVIIWIAWAVASFFTAMASE